MPWILLLGGSVWAVAGFSSSTSSSGSSASGMRVGGGGAGGAATAACGRSVIPADGGIIRGGCAGGELVCAPNGTPGRPSFMTSSDSDLRFVPKPSRIDPTNIPYPRGNGQYIEPDQRFYFGRPIRISTAPWRGTSHSYCAVKFPKS